MIPKECKRLAEVDFPIAVVSKHAAREKSIRHGHPSTLHLWWARRPLAACRAMLLGLLLPDPCDEHCPEDFKRTSRELLPKVQGHVGPKEEDLRKSLLKFIGDFANWDLSADRTYVEISRALIKAAHGEETPLVIDPFAGGGSIPLEALRLDCDVFSNELNPIPWLLCKVLLDDVPRFGSQLTEGFADVLENLRLHLKNKVGQFYPASSADEQPTAYLWARTVDCESPRCGATFPLLRSLWLSRSRSESCSLVIKVDTHRSVRPEIALKVRAHKNNEMPRKGTVYGGRAVCPACSATLSRSSIEAQLKTRRGGTDSARLVAVMIGTEIGRTFRAPLETDFAALTNVTRIETALREQRFEGGVSVFPDESINPLRPSPNARGLSAVTRYGMKTFSDCYLPRQRLVLSEFVRFVRDYNLSESSVHGAVGRCLLILLGRCVDRWSSCCRLDSTRDTVTGSFSKQALQMVWDFCEANPFSKWSGGIENAIEWIIGALKYAQVSLSRSAQVNIGDARSLPVPDQSAQVCFTDPPYYDSVPYADLADFFFCWLRRAAPTDLSFRDPFDASNVLTPKTQECVWNNSYSANGKQKDSNFFEQCMADAFNEGKRILEPAGIGCVVFAHKSTEGWEALLSGITKAGLYITSSWPIQTEMKARTAAKDAASLMGSVHLVFRPRPENATIGEWAQVLSELPKRVREWMDRLNAEGIHGADLVFACIGPALEIYSRYSKVVDAEDREIPLGGDPEATEPYKRGYLAYVWEAVGRAALEQVLGTAEAGARNGAAGASEEDARLTALFLWTLQSTNGEDKEKGKSKKAKGEEIEEEESEEDEDDEEETSTKGKKKKGLTLVFDVVRRFAQPLGIHLDNWEDRIIETEKGIVRLLPVGERGAQLFGQDGADLVAERVEREPASTFQLTLFPEKTDAAPKVKGEKTRGKKGTDKDLRTNQEATTLDRVHAAMLLQASGRTNALRALLQAEQDRGPDFLRLANALSALYPRESEEKRLLDAMLLAAPR